MQTAGYVGVARRASDIVAPLWSRQEQPNSVDAIHQDGGARHCRALSVFCRVLSVIVVIVVVNVDIDVDIDIKIETDIDIDRYMTTTKRQR